MVNAIKGYFHVSRWNDLQHGASMRIKILLISLIVLSLSLPVFARNVKRLPNGYQLDPAGTHIAATLAKVFRGYYKLVRNNGDCEAVAIRYTDLGENDKYYMYIVKLADQNGNRNGIAEYNELQAYYDLACEHRGE